mgnify:CR=1 FL=1
MERMEKSTEIMIQEIKQVGKATEIMIQEVKQVAKATERMENLMVLGFGILGLGLLGLGVGLGFLGKMIT